MPKRTDLQRILLIGSGPIVIGQAAEFDYSGTQAAKALKEEGYFVVLVNSNPATIMTDPELADRTYIEPVTPERGRKGIDAARAIQRAEDRAEFSAALRRIGLATPVGRTVASVADGLTATGETGFPA